MPEELLILSIIGIMAGTTMALVKMTLNYRAQKRAATGSPDSSMTTSELERMMRRAVAEASKPMMDKLEDIELGMSARNKPRKLEEPRTDLLLDMEDPDREAAPVKTTRREHS